MDIPLTDFWIGAILGGAIVATLSMLTSLITLLILNHRDGQIISKAQDYLMQLVKKEVD